MEDNAGKFYIEDGVVKDAAQMETIDWEAGNKVYEVIRIIDGVPLFFEDHYTRMGQSLHSIGGILTLQAVDLKKQIAQLVKANDQINCNVKFLVFVANDRQKRVGYVSKSYYPSTEQVNKGVAVGLLQLERATPNVKLLNQTYKQTVKKKIVENKFFEVLLVNHNENITEGSASNAFFVKDNKIFTAPGEAVLKGITRQYVFEACKNAGYEVTEAFTSVSELDQVEGAFLSGTSIKVLPIATINDKVYPSAQHPVVVAVRDAYDHLLTQYIQEHKI